MLLHYQFEFSRRNKQLYNNFLVKLFDIDLKVSKCQFDILEP